MYYIVKHGELRAFCIPPRITQPPLITCTHTTQRGGAPASSFFFSSSASSFFRPFFTTVGAPSTCGRPAACCHVGAVEAETRVPQRLAPLPLHTASPRPPLPPRQQQSAEGRADRRPFWECARAAAGRAPRAHQLLGLLEPQVGDAADLLDDLDLGGRVKAVQLEVKLRLLLLLLRGSRCCRAAWRGWWAGGWVCVF